jgi:hypothetical protein
VQTSLLRLDNGTTWAYVREDSIGTRDETSPSPAHPPACSSASVILRILSKTAVELIVVLSCIRSGESYLPIYPSMDVSTQLVDFLVLDSPSSFAVVILAGLDIYTYILRESSQKTRN